MKHKLYLLLFSIACLLSSCSVYKPGMEQVENDPISQKLPTLNYNFSSSNITGGKPEFIDMIVRNEVYKNIMNKDGSPNGTLDVVCSRFYLRQSMVFPFLSGATLFIGNLLGMPFSTGEVAIDLSFIFKTENGDQIKRYDYTESGNCTLGFYYGKDISVKTLELCRNIIEEFKQDISADSYYITQSLNDSRNTQTTPLDYNLLADAIVAKSTDKNIPSADNSPAKKTVSPVIKSDVDINIPVTGVKSEDTFVLIIANENYSFVSNVPFAHNDGEIFKEYCIKTLGVPERQVWLYRDATAGIISGAVDKMVQAMSIFDNAKAIVYYCGHGIPDEKTSDAFIIPTDGKGTNTVTCYSLNTLYKTMAESNARSVTYFMDACFTGANKDGSMLVQARGVAIKPKAAVIRGNSVVFSAASADETAMAFEEKSHGMFTYFLLKKIQETKGKVNYGELSEYISKNVKKEAFLTNEKPQTPITATSTNISDTWKSMTLF